MEGRTIFVSHQWLGYDHPDPDGSHLAELQQLLTDLMSGKIPKVESSWNQQIVTKKTITLTAKEWAAALPHMFIWIDYAGIPQVRAEPEEASPVARKLSGKLSASSIDSLPKTTRSSMASNPDEMTRCTDGMEIIEKSSSMSVGNADLGRSLSTELVSKRSSNGSTAASVSSVASSDHRFRPEPSSIAADLKKAIDSIPGYVERSSLMLVLVPPCSHADTSLTCNFSTWRSRGWCRVEFMAAHLSRKGINVMIHRGGSNPYFVFPVDALNLPAGRGHFSCCALGHSLNGKSIPCDKANLEPIIDGMVRRKMRHLQLSGQREPSLFHAAMNKRFLDGLTSQEEMAESRLQVASMQPCGPLAVEKLKEKLSWQPEDEVASLKTGWTLLMCAAMANDLEAVRHILKGGHADVNRGFRQPWPELSCAPSGLTPIMAAMAFSGFEIVEELLSANADPRATDNDGRGLDAFILACVFGRADNLEKWLQRFPKWDLERRTSSVGATAFHAAAAYPPSSAPSLSILLKARADPHTGAHAGWNALNFAVQKDDSDPEAVRLLLDAGLDVNRQSQPITAKWKATHVACRSAYRLGKRTALLDLFANVEGDTALHNAYATGHSEIIELLKANGADEELQNKLGLKPKDMMA